MNVITEYYPAFSTEVGMNVQLGIHWSLWSPVQGLQTPLCSSGPCGPQEHQGSEGYPWDQ